MSNDNHSAKCKVDQAKFGDNFDRIQRNSKMNKKVINIVRRQLGWKDGEVSEGSEIVNDLGLDSLDTVELVMAIEASFNIEIPDEEAAKVVTVADIINLVK